MWAAASPRFEGLVAGRDRADSWAVDAHKWLNVPYDCAFAIVAPPEALPRAMAVNAAYLARSDHREPAEFVPEASRRGRAIPVYAALRYLGRRGVAELVERCCGHATLMASLLREGGLEVLNDVVLNQVPWDEDQGQRCGQGEHFRIDPASGCLLILSWRARTSSGAYESSA